MMIRSILLLILGAFLGTMLMIILAVLVTEKGEEDKDKWTKE